MTPDEKQTWYVELIVCTVTGLLTLFVLLVHFTGYVYANQSTSTDYLPKQIRMLGLGCPACHLVKQPPNECGEFTGWLWEECVDLVHRYPDEKGQDQQLGE